MSHIGSTVIVCIYNKNEPCKLTWNGFVFIIPLFSKFFWGGFYTFFLVYVSYYVKYIVLLTPAISVPCIQWCFRALSCSYFSFNQIDHPKIPRNKQFGKNCFHLIFHANKLKYSNSNDFFFLMKKSGKVVLLDQQSNFTVGTIQFSISICV